MQGFRKTLRSGITGSGITVVSAGASNAIPVAEFVLAQILLLNKGYFRNIREYRDPSYYAKSHYGPGNFGVTVALLGAGLIGRKLIELLLPFSLPVIVFDPFLSDADAIELGVTRVSLQDAFALGTVISNHLADVPETVGLLNGKLFASMQPGAAFINTGRGATVCESQLLEVLECRSDIMALLDVTHPEPPVAGSRFYTLPNVYLSTHMAGSRGRELVRMADTVIEEFQAWSTGRPLRHAVSAQMLEKMT